MESSCGSANLRGWASMMRHSIPCSLACRAACVRRCYEKQACYEIGCYENGTRGSLARPFPARNTFPNATGRAISLNNGGPGPIVAIRASGVHLYCIAKHHCALQHGEMRDTGKRRATRKPVATKAKIHPSREIARWAVAHNAKVEFA